MKRPRRWIVNAFLSVLVAGSLYDISRDEEHWPFSQYPMFAGIWRNTSFTWYRLVGIRDDGQEWVIVDREFLKPFDNSRLHHAFVRLAKRPDAETALRDAVANCLDRYERQRLSGAHHGPPLRALRLYQFRWKLDPQLRNVYTPDNRRFVAEAGLQKVGLP